MAKKKRVSAKALKSIRAAYPRAKPAKKKSKGKRKAKREARIETATLIPTDWHAQMAPVVNQLVASTTAVTKLLSEAIGVLSLIAEVLDTSGIKKPKAGATKRAQPKPPGLDEAEAAEDFDDEASKAMAEDNAEETEEESDA